MTVFSLKTAFSGLILLVSIGDLQALHNDESHRKNLQVEPAQVGDEFDGLQRHLTPVDPSATIEYISSSSTSSKTEIYDAYPRTTIDSITSSETEGFTISDVVPSATIESVTSSSTSATQVTDTEVCTNTNGVEGVDNGVVCCESSCGTCGGSGCAKRGNYNAECCQSKIEAAGMNCDDTGSPPCIISEGSG